MATRQPDSAGVGLRKAAELEDYDDILAKDDPISYIKEFEKGAIIQTKPGWVHPNGDLNKVGQKKAARLIHKCAVHDNPTTKAYYIEEHLKAIGDFFGKKRHSMTYAHMKSYRTEKSKRENTAKRLNQRLRDEHKRQEIAENAQLKKALDNAEKGKDATEDMVTELTKERKQQNMLIGEQAEQLDEQKKQMAEKDETIDEQKKLIGEKDETIAKQKKQMSKKDETIDEQKKQMAEKDETIAKQKKTIQELQDQKAKPTITKK